MNEIIEEIYHGTDIVSAKSILQTQKFDKSINADDWLGSGVYFYDNIDNAILYNVRKYKNKNKEYPTYEQLERERKIIVVKIQYREDDLLDLNDMSNMGKFLGLWKMFYDRVKNDSKYKDNKYKDGYMINWLIENTEYFKGCKVISNIFALDLKFNRRINKIFHKQTRIGYTLQQKFLCVIDDSCIKSITIYTNNYKNEYNIIKNLTNNIIVIGDENEI